MSAFTYTAKRGLISGHVADTVYSFDLKIKKYDPNYIVDSNQQNTNSEIETIFNGFVASHKFTTTALTQAEADEVLEFLLSAMSGELVSFDATGTVAIPVSVKSGTVKAVKNIKISQPSHKMFAFNFEIIEL